MQECVIISWKVSATYFFLHLTKPKIITSLTFGQFCDALQPELLASPYQRLPVSDASPCSILARARNEICWNRTQKAAVRWFELPKITDAQHVQSAEWSHVAACRFVGADVSYDVTELLVHESEQPSADRTDPIDY